MHSAAPADPRIGDEERPLDRAQRRQVAKLHAVVFAFYAIDGVLLTGFALLGVLPLGFGAAFAAAGGFFSGVAVLAFRRGRQRMRDLAANNVAMTLLAAAQMLTAALLAPQIGVPMLMSQMTVLAATALQLGARPLLATWGLCAVGTAAAMIASPQPFELPMATPAARLASAVWFAWLLGKCALVSVESTRLRLLATQANARLLQALDELEKIATTDELTVLPNRRSIVHGLHAALAQGAKPASVAVALFDIDHFKRVNDRHGHAVGDEVLREFGALVSRGLRPTDTVGRYGGEEFLLVLQQAGTAATARETADRMRRSVESFDWGRLVPGLAVTASAGVALVGPGESADQAIARADQALYRAKAAGRNRVVLG